MDWTFTESSPFGLDWTQKFDRISGLGLDGQIFGWAGQTGLLFEATTMDWTGLDLILRMGLDFWRTQERQKCVQSVQMCLISSQMSCVTIMFNVEHDRNARLEIDRIVILSISSVT